MLAFIVARVSQQRCCALENERSTETLVPGIARRSWAIRETSLNSALCSCKKMLSKKIEFEIRLLIPPVQGVVRIAGMAFKCVPKPFDLGDHNCLWCSVGNINHADIIQEVIERARHPKRIAQKFNCLKRLKSLCLLFVCPSKLNLNKNGFKGLKQFIKGNGWSLTEGVCRRIRTC